MSKPTVAIIGVSGFLGKPVLEAFESEVFADKFQFPIKALTRSDKPSTDKVEYIKGDLNDPESVASTLSGVDVIIELLGANPTTFAAVESIVKIVKPKLFIPSQFGTEIEAVNKYASGFLALKTKHSQNIRDEGIKVADVITSLFAVPGSLLYEVVGAVGINPENKTVTYRGDPETEFAISKLGDVGRSVASIASQDPSSIPDKFRVYSQTITYKEIVESYEKKHDVKLTPSYVSKEDTKKELKEKLDKGFKPTEFLFYLNAIVAQGIDGGLSFSENEREIVNPGESLWKWEKY